MERLLQNYSTAYAERQEQQIYEGDEQRALRNPVLFVFIGDLAGAGLFYMQQEVKKRWENGNGVLFFQIGSSIHSGDSNVLEFPVEVPKVANQQLRQEIYHRFYQNPQKLFALNQTIRKIRGRIAAFGGQYVSCEKVQISVITQADDPINVLVPEITVLLQNKLRETFKQVSVDLYGLIEENDEEEQYGFHAAAAMSFFRELQYMQQPTYTFRQPIEVLEEGMAIDTVHEGRPLFDFTYLLSNKNEAGVYIEVQTNYDSIIAVNLLKNRHNQNDFHESQNLVYSDVQFKQNLQMGWNHSYISAGLAKVKRPNSRIARTVLYHFYDHFLGQMHKGDCAEAGEIIGLLQIDTRSIEIEVKRLVPAIEKIAEMHGILSSNTASNQLYGLSLLEIEDKLYGNVCREFFEHNYQQIAYKRLEEMDPGQRLLTDLKKMVQNPRYGCYSMFEWSDDKHENSILVPLRAEIQSVKRQISQRQQELQVECNREPLSGNRSPFIWTEKQKMRKLKENLFQVVYHGKVEILQMEIGLALMQVYEKAIEQFHQDIGVQIQALEELRSKLCQGAASFKKDNGGYLEANISEYYDTVVKKILTSLEVQRGEDFYWEERFIGNPYESLEEGPERLLHRMIEVCEKEILTDPLFRQSFEDELLHRANVTTEYGNTEVLTQKELFQKLYHTLEQAAGIHIYIYHFTQKNRYEETYYFGDYYSDFMQYILGTEEIHKESRQGCIHEKRTSGIECLKLMGGFQIMDLVYARNCKKYYDLYTERGYMLHGIDTSDLAE